MAPGARGTRWFEQRSTAARFPAAMADDGARTCGRGCYGTGTSGMKKGKRAGAHSEDDEQVSGLGGGSEQMARPWRSRLPEVEDDDGESVRGRPTSRESSRRRVRQRRSSWARQRGEGVALAAAAVSGGDGCVRGVFGREPGKGVGEGGREGVPGGAWASPWRSSEDGGGRARQREAGGGRGRTRAPRFPSAYWQEEEDGGGACWAGPTVLGRPLQLGRL